MKTSTFIFSLLALTACSTSSKNKKVPWEPCLPGDLPKISPLQNQKEDLSVFPSSHSLGHLSQLSLSPPPPPPPPPVGPKRQAHRQPLSAFAPVHILRQYLRIKTAIQHEPSSKTATTTTKCANITTATSTKPTTTCITSIEPTAGTNTKTCTEPTTVATTAASTESTTTANITTSTEPTPIGTTVASTEPTTTITTPIEPTTGTNTNTFMEPTTIEGNIASTETSCVTAVNTSTEPTIRTTDASSTNLPLHQETSPQDKQKSKKHAPQLLINVNSLYHIAQYQYPSDNFQSNYIKQ